jgi:hypothetical protein
MRSSVISKRQMHRRRGISIVYLAISLGVIVVLATLGVDLGRVQLAKTELRAAADAAARAAAAKVAKGGALAQVRAEAITWASYNTADGGRSVTLLPGDIETGNWNAARTPKFVVSSTDINAVRVTASLTAARNSAVPLSFAGIVGITSCDVSVVAIATFQSQGYSVIGLDYVRMGGNSSSSYWSSGGSGTDKLGSVASNGDITLTGSTLINGDARPGVGKTVYGADKVTGSTAPLTTPLSFPNGDAGSHHKFNDNGYIPGSFLSGADLTVAKNQDLTLPGGNYYVRDLTLAAGGNLTFTGPATIYAYGTVDLSGHATTSGSVPGNLSLIMVPLNGTPPGSVNIGSKSAMYMTIYAPQSPILLSGTGDIYGSLLGKSIDMTGTSAIHYDMDIAAAAPLITLVQ